LKNKTSTKSNLIGIIILAAGASRRMGTPKQLLKIDNQTLIERAVSLTQALNNQQTVVVLGANAAKISPYISEQEKVNVIINENWQQGMGTTLKTGMEFLLQQTNNFAAIIVMVCDQPYLSTETLQQLIDKYQATKAAIIATEYKDIKGVPALFDKRIFPRLTTKVRRQMKNTKVINNSM